MRFVSLIPAFAALFICGAANAQSWDTYSNQENFFSVNFPGTPVTTQAPYKTAKGTHGAVLQNRAFGFAPALPESATDYEVGYKADFLDHHLRIDAAGYITHYANKQETIITGAPPTTVTASAWACPSSWRSPPPTEPMCGPGPGPAAACRSPCAFPGCPGHPDRFPSRP